MPEGSITIRIKKILLVLNASISNPKKGMTNANFPTTLNAGTLKSSAMLFASPLVWKERISPVEEWTFPMEIIRCVTKVPGLLERL